MSKDEREIRYYKEKLYEKNPDYERHAVPHFASESTNWQFKQMNEVMSFCEHNDTHKPNFLNVAIKQGLLAQSKSESDNEEELTEEDLEKIESARRYYYLENW